MDRFIALDIGDKRIGIAVSDPFNSYALPLETYTRKNLKTDLERIGAIVKEKGATGVVAGLPVNFDGTLSVQTQKAEFFIEKLRGFLGISVFTVDERCTTCEAEEILVSQGKSRQERKACVDSLAAAGILDGFLSEMKLKNQKKENIMSEKEKKHCDCGCEHEHTKGHSHDECCEEDCDCDCGCEDDIVELTTDDGKKLKFYFVGTIEYKGKNYSAFEPAEEIEGMSEDDIVIFELAGDGEDGADLLPVEDDALLDEVFEEFCRVLDEDEMADEAEKLEK